MMRIEVLGPDDFVSMPWRNGLGTTLELAGEHDEAGTLLWRVSMADVVEAGPFSPFPGMDRILTLIEGAGFDLDFAGHGRVTPVTPLVPVRFSGNWATRAENVAGPSQDLNVMLARGRVFAEVVVLGHAGSLPAFGDRTLLYCLTGGADLAVGETHHALLPHKLAIVRDARGQTGSISGAGTIVRIDIRMKQPS